MTDASIERLAAQVERTEAELSQALADPELPSDRARFAEVGRRHSALVRAFELARAYREAQRNATEAEELLAADGEQDDYRAILRDAEEEMERLGPELRDAMIEPDPDDDRDTIVEIRAAAGGDEAALFARDLFDVYTKYAESQGLRIELLGTSPSDTGGMREVTFAVKGAGAFARFKHEGGVHRVQRVPETESQGRIHTSTVTVAVVPEVEDVETAVDQNDLKIDVYRSSGPGGQSVNTTDSAVRVTHVPTGIVVSMQDEKSQLQNRERAMRVLRARLHDRAKAEQEAALSATRRAQLGSGDRSEKVRTYNYPQNRVSDHRVDAKLSLREQVLVGDLAPFTEALAAEERRLQLEQHADAAA